MKILFQGDSITDGARYKSRACAKETKNLTAQSYEEGYRRLLTMSREKNPDLKIILLEPFAHIEGQQNTGTTETVRRAVLKSEQKAVHRLAEEFDAVFVPLQSVFDKAMTVREPSYWIWDGTHPTEAGHALIAREYLKALRSLLDIKTEI